MHEWVGNDKMLLSDITQCLEKEKREKDFKNLGKIVIICQSIHIFRNTWCFINSPISSTTFYTIWKLLQKVSFYNFEVSILASNKKSNSTILRGCIAFNTLTSMMLKIKMRHFWRFSNTVPWRSFEFLMKRIINKFSMKIHISIDQWNA